MTAPSLAPQQSPSNPPSASTLASLRDLADSFVFYGLFGIGILAPVCLALYAELIR